MCRASFLLVGLLLLVGCSEVESDRLMPVTGLRVDTVLGGAGDDGYQKATGPRAFSFPSDHGAHPRYRSEWWYLTAVLEDEAGRDYGLHYTLFRQALAPAPTGEGPWQTAQAYLAHLAITDIETGTHVMAERFSRAHPGLAMVSVDESFNAVIEDWTLSGSAGNKLSLDLDAGEFDQFKVDVRITQKAPIVLQGDRGYSEKGVGAASYYYSMPRLLVEGTLEIADRSVQVKGLGWLDREWSTSVLGEHLAGWDWFALQLDDDRSVMAFQLRREDGNRDDFDHGLIVDHRLLPEAVQIHRDTPGVTLLKPHDFRLSPTRFYEDDQGVNWPVAWRLEVGDEQLEVIALLDDQRMNLSIVYWEGLVEVLNSDQQRVGRGYMELTGYNR